MNNNINVQLEKLTVPIASLSFDPKNARIHDARNMKAIEASYEKFGQQKPLVVSEDNVVLAGNGQLQAAINLKWDSIAVVKYAGDAETMGAYALADNRTGELAYWDMDNLQQILDGLPSDLIDTLEFSEFTYAAPAEFDMGGESSDDDGDEADTPPTAREDGVAVKEIVTLTLSFEAYAHWHKNVKGKIEDIDAWVLGL